MSHSIHPLHELAECYVFVKQSHGPIYCASRHYPGGPLLPKLRGYVAEFLNEVYLARLGIFVPSHLCRFWYGWRVNTSGLFWEAGTHELARGEPQTRSVRHPYVQELFHQLSPLSFSKPNLNPHQCRNVNLLSIDYAFRPHLRCRLTPGGRTCPGKPWDSGDQNFHLVFRYSCPHNH